MKGPALGLLKYTVTLYANHSESSVPKPEYACATHDNHIGRDDGVPRRSLREGLKGFGGCKTKDKWE